MAKHWNQEINVHMGKRLRRRRKLLHMTQMELGELIGVRFQQIQKYECGLNQMTAERLWSLSKVLQVPVSYFYEGLDSRVQPSQTHCPESAALLEAFVGLREPSRIKLMELVQAMREAQHEA